MREIRIYFFQSNKFDVMVSIKLFPNVLVTHDWIPSIGSLLTAYNATPPIAIKANNFFQPSKLAIFFKKSFYFF